MYIPLWNFVLTRAFNLNLGICICRLLCTGRQFWSTTKKLFAFVGWLVRKHHLLNPDFSIPLWVQSPQARSSKSSSTLQPTSVISTIPALIYRNLKTHISSERSLESLLCSLSTTPSLSINQKSRQICTYSCALFLGHKGDFMPHHQALTARSIWIVRLRRTVRILRLLNIFLPFIPVGFVANGVWTVLYPHPGWKSDLESLCARSLAKEHLPRINVVQLLILRLTKVLFLLVIPGASLPMTCREWPLFTVSEKSKREIFVTIGNFWIIFGSIYSPYMWLYGVYMWPKWLK